MSAMLLQAHAFILPVFKLQLDFGGLLVHAKASLLLKSKEFLTNTRVYLLLPDGERFAENGFEVYDQISFESRHSTA